MKTKMQLLVILAVTVVVLSATSHAAVPVTKVPSISEPSSNAFSAPADVFANGSPMGILAELPPVLSPPSVPAPVKLETDGPSVKTVAEGAPPILPIPGTVGPVRPSVGMLAEGLPPVLPPPSVLAPTTLRAVRPSVGMSAEGLPPVLPRIVKRATDQFGFDSL